MGVVALVGGLLLPAAAQAQTERLAGRMDERTRSAVTALVDSARAEGLPGDPLVNKALEGASKGADGARIVVAVRALADNLGRARAVLGGSASAAELVAGAAALRAGAPPAFLARLRADYPGAPAVVPLAVMADLVARGVPADTAVRAVLALARAGCGTPSWWPSGRAWSATSPSAPRPARRRRCASTRPSATSRTPWGPPPRRRRAPGSRSAARRSCPRAPRADSSP